MDGLIIKGIGGFYYVKTELGILECHARGRLRKLKISPLVGDRVSVLVSKTEEMTGSIESIYTRNNSFIRPPVANIDNIVITFSVTDPEPNLMLIDKLTAIAMKSSVGCVICINKIDLNEEGAEHLADIYTKSGFPVICSSSKDNIGIDDLKSVLKDKTSALAGNSGVGKSSIINNIDETLNLKTGTLSSKIKRGRHTTRHTELFALNFGGYILDTPGFSTFELTDIDPDSLCELFPEIQENSHGCRFTGCRHKNEPDCSVKEAVGRGDIAKSRYESYIELYNELELNNAY